MQPLITLNFRISVPVVLTFLIVDCGLVIGQLKFEWAWKAASKTTKRGVPVRQEHIQRSALLKSAPVVFHRKIALDKTASSFALHEELEVVWLE